MDALFRLSRNEFSPKGFRENRLRLFLGTLRSGPDPLFNRVVKSPESSNLPRSASQSSVSEIL
jgi:hypothetical protein